MCNGLIEIFIVLKNTLQFVYVETRDIVWPSVHNYIYKKDCNLPDVKMYITSL